MSENHPERTEERTETTTETVTEPVAVPEPDDGEEGPDDDSKPDNPA